MGTCWEILASFRLERISWTIETLTQQCQISLFGELGVPGELGGRMGTPWVPGDEWMGMPNLMCPLFF